GDIALDVAQRVHHASLVLVTTPQPVATHVAARAANVAQRAGQTILGVIENMSYVRCPHGDRLEIFGHGGGEDLARALKVPLLGQVPLEADVREGADTGQPIVLTNPDTEAAKVFLGVATRILEIKGA
ncbi:MAG: P-loop NTPase, partial [Clostridia bacterium]